MSTSLQVDAIIFARGGEANPGLCDRVLAAFPAARVTSQPDLAPARASLDVAPTHSRVEAGKRTLVVGAIGHVLGQNCEPGMGQRVVCYPYWHFNAVGNCPYDCLYCYLTGNRGNLKCPAIKLYTNLGELVAAIQRVADRASAPVLFYGSKLQDFVALDWLTRYAETLVPFAAQHPKVRLLFLTKCGDLSTLLPLKHGAHTILSWTLNAEAVISRYELRTPSLDERLEAARQAAQAGYEVRFVFMPVLPVPGWRQAYATAIHRALAKVRPNRITLGSLCMYRSALNVMRRRLAERRISPWDGREENLSSFSIQPPTFPGDRYRLRMDIRLSLYRHILACIRQVDPRIPVSLCLETPQVWAALGLQPAEAPCNCLL